MTKRFIREFLVSMALLGAIGCAEGTKVDDRDDPPVTVCQPEWEARCILGGTQMEDVTCGLRPIPMMQCANGCVMGSCLSPGEQTPLDEPPCAPHWEPMCVGAGAALVEVNCGLEPSSCARTGATGATGTGASSCRTSSPA